MKHLKKFNEELNISTYTSAADKLRKYGHKERADKLVDHAYNVRSNKKGSELDKPDVNLTINGKQHYIISTEFKSTDLAMYLQARHEYTNPRFIRSIVLYLSEGKVLELSGDKLYLADGTSMDRYFKNYETFKFNNRKDAISLKKYLDDFYPSNKSLINLNINDLYNDSFIPKKLSKHTSWDNTNARPIKPEEKKGLFSRIKKTLFNEELNQDTYLSASSKLKRKGHNTRSNDLRDYGEEYGEVGEYTFILGDSEGNITGSSYMSSQANKWDSGGYEFTINFDNNMTLILRISLSGEFDGLSLNKNRKDNPLNIRRNSALSEFRFNDRKDALEFKKYLIKRFPKHSDLIKSISINQLYR